MRLVMKTLGTSLAVGCALAGAAAPALAAGHSDAATAACRTEVLNGPGVRATLDICTTGGTTRVTGGLTSTVDDGKCTRLTVTIGRYSGSWTVCDGESADVDTGSHVGTSTTYRFVTT
ncbi:hypothetical protein [Streptomyces sp. UG1]|uniref:hypothetical protein n=1 Tax=Streptomyces sp. UG1 TaxID=3417652 RepID=UPI003CF2B605